ncbi:MAG: DUF2071 domain-containing protein [Holophagales bacterium]|jgi:hypothetical protein|nr:DUF2071 domain-containing protein [Holophagales bacterium]
MRRRLRRELQLARLHDLPVRFAEEGKPPGSEGLDGSAPFLTAEWRHLAILNYEVDPVTLRPLVPKGTELDDWNGRHLASVVGFLFVNTRVLGVPVPFHTNFPEVNLRFYVRRRVPDGWHRGVVFVKEIVPRAAIAWMARTLYNERYVALPMSYSLESGDGEVRGASYCWTHRGREERVEVTASAPAAVLVPGSEAEFVVEHYWGYVSRRDGGTTGYRVAHPPWRLAPASRAHLQADVTALYGAEFAAPLSAAPASAFLAEGSAVTVHGGVRLGKEGEET